MKRKLKKIVKYQMIKIWILKKIQIKKKKNMTEKKIVIVHEIKINLLLIFNLS